MSAKHAELTLALLALASLCVGAAVYLFDRSGGALFVPGALAAMLPARSLFGGFSGSLPTFAHVFAFALLTAAVLGLRPKRAMPVCLAWAMVEALFEFGQLDAAQRALGAVVADWRVSGWLLDRTLEYFARGTFDIADLFSIALGAAAAYVLIILLSLGESEHARE